MPNDALYRELWHACAGPLVTVPRQGERVYYFPQGHMEQVLTGFCASLDLPRSISFLYYVIIMPPNAHGLPYWVSSLQTAHDFFCSLRRLHTSSLTSTYRCSNYHPRSCAA
jgi:hypothetical protein